MDSMGMGSSSTLNLKGQLKIEQRKVFLRNEKYECQGTVVLCTATTCNLTSNTFEAIYLGDTNQFANMDGSAKTPKNMIGDKMKCMCVSYKPFTRDITF